ncbi:hypothetical protein NMY22_g10291 [Coprinellus aureogranulatus]|nr:hypothetical protein NMY22_g10291 [Coprinellus aureogranulatus]
MLERKIEKAKAALAIMEAQQASHRKFIDEYSMLYSPIRRLPNDILALIFQTCLKVMNDKPDRYIFVGHGISHKHPSVVVSHVCRTWRTLALREKRLWSYLRFTIGPFGMNLPPEDDNDEMDSAVYREWCERVETLRQNVKAWLDRSSPCPLALEMDYEDGLTHDELLNDKYHPEAARKYEALVATLCQFSTRWQSLRCIVQPGVVDASIIRLFDRPHGHFPILNSVNICVGDDNRGNYNHVPKLTTSDIFSAPSLREVSLYGCLGDIAAAKARSTTSIHNSVAHLDFHPIVLVEEDGTSSNHGLYPTQALDTLSLLPNLISIVLRLDVRRPLDLPLPSPVTLRHLTSMSIISGLPLPKGFGQCLDLPSLTTLHLDCLGFGMGAAKDNSGQAELLLLFGRQLKELSFFHATMPPMVLPRCLEQLSTL